MKKLSLILLVLFTSLSAKAGCDFSGITFDVINQHGNNYYFQTNMHSDTCWYYTFTAYSFTNKEEYKLDNNGGWTGVTFNQKGKYEVRLNVFNECEKCDTVFTIDVDITIFGKEANCVIKQDSRLCSKYLFELKDFKDSCTEYYFQFWKADSKLNNMTEKEWNNMNDSAIYFTYSWEEDLLEYYNTKSQVKINYEFQDVDSRYIVLASYYNECTGIDTWFFRKITPCKTPSDKVLSVKKILSPVINAKILKMYDLLGREAEEMIPGKVYVILYSDGRRQKVIRTR